MLSLSYTPPGPVLRAFLTSDAFVRGVMGPIGSGKSTACIMELLRRAAQQKPGPDGRRASRWAVIRNTFPELKTTTIKSWHQWVPASTGRWRDSGPPMHHIVDDALDLEVMFVALDSPDDVRKLLSLELTGAWINEAREVPKAVLDGLTGRVGRFPPMRDGGATWSGVIMDTNPPDSDGWWFKLAEEAVPADFAFFRQPPGDGPRAENLANLPAGYYERASAGKDEDWVKVYVRGEYGFAIDGKPVYHEYRDSLHCRPFELNPALPLAIGIDFGLTPAAVIGQRTLFGQWLWRAEVVTEDMGALRFAEVLGAELRGRFGGFKVATITGDPAGDTRAQTDERTPFEILKAAGLAARPAPSNDWNLRRESVASALSRLVDGQPGLLVHPDCRVLRKGMAGAYAYRRLKVAGQERHRDVPDKTMHSHVCEAGQYLMLGAGEGRALLRRDRRGPPPAAVAETDYPMFA